MKEPDRRGHAYTAWDFDSFARFDDLVERDKTLQIGYRLMPDDERAPGIVSRVAVLDPLAKISAVGSFVTKLAEVLT